jgi:hypothetical protein
MRELTEQILKSELCAHLRRQLPFSEVYRIEDQSMVGIPDMIVNWRGCSTWIEGKHAKPKIRTKHRSQTVIMDRLSRASRAFYVVWGEAAGELRTFLVEPAVVLANAWHLDLPHLRGINHEAVAQRIRETHR